MQPLIGSPRENLTEDEVYELLTGDSLSVRCGVEVVDEDGQMEVDLTDSLVDGSIQRDNYADIHGSCKLELTAPYGLLVWGRERVRPYMELSNDVTTARFNLGVYVLTTPESPEGESPMTFKVDGYDLLYLLHTTGPGDTYVVNSGTTYYAAIQGVLSAAGVSVPLALDGTYQTQTIPSTMVWALHASPDSWLVIINDLLHAIGYRDLWCDQDGTYRSGPYLTPGERPVEWTFDTFDESTCIIGEDRTMSADLFGVPNWWRFIGQEWATQPVEGNGFYTVTNQSFNSTSIDVVGRTIRKVVYLSAPNQFFLEVQGNEIVAEDRRVARTFKVKVDPLPIAGHLDVVDLIDGFDQTIKCQVRSWTLPFDGGQGDWVLEIA